MGNARRRRSAFFAAFPWCIFCGGSVASTTIEHCPPRALFQFKEWPEGFEFPSCLDCNKGSSDADLLIAMLARMDPINDMGDQDGRLTGLMKNVNAQYPGMFGKMMLSANEARRKNKELGIFPPPGKTHQDAGAVHVTDEMDDAMRVFAAKLAKAIYFLDSGKIFPNEGPLLMNWFTNVDLIKTGSYGVFDVLKDLGGSAPKLVRTNKYLNDQFEYKYSPTPEKDVFALQVRLGNSFGFVVFGAIQRGKFDDAIARIKSESGNDATRGLLQ